MTATDTTGRSRQESTVTIELPTEDAQLIAGVLAGEKARAAGEEPDSAARYAAVRSRVMGQLKEQPSTSARGDIRQVDLWECLDCSVANINVGMDRECSSCGGELDYLGEVDYENLTLGGGENGDH